MIIIIIIIIIIMLKFIKRPNEKIFAKALYRWLRVSVLKHVRLESLT